MENGQIVKRDEGLPAPGFGVAGQVLCPLMSLTHPAMCVKGACEMWVELTYGAGTKDQRQVGRCSYAWTAILQAENTQELIKLREALEKRGDHV